MIDHTLLKPDATKAEIETLCREAMQHGFASVCVNPTWVATCAPWCEGVQSQSVPSSDFHSAPRPQIRSR